MAIKSAQIATSTTPTNIVTTGGFNGNGDVNTPISVTLYNPGTVAIYVGPSSTGTPLSASNGFLVPPQVASTSPGPPTVFTFYGGDFSSLYAYSASATTLHVLATSQ